MALDGDSPFPLEIHAVQDLIPELTLADKTRVLDQSIGERRLAVVNVGNNAEVTYSSHKIRKPARQC
jgi:hypothetical protein